MKSYIKGPIVAGIIMEGLVLALSLLLYFTQDKLRAMMSISMHIGVKIFPYQIIEYLVLFIAYVIFLLVMSSFEGSSSRGACVGMLAALVIINIASPYLISLQNVFGARTSTEYVGALSVLSSLISRYTAPLSTIATTLVIVAVARFGVEGEYREPSAPAGIAPAAFGGGYTINQ
ncbi:MAG: hypothetical protein K5686_09015 [Lachnospiraceae bacterium]|nr:hypothetical protein [Lachnospiraceae bacterium]